VDRVVTAIEDKDVKFVGPAFAGHTWKREINVRDFIQNNVTPYFGDESFLAPATARSLSLWDTVSKLMAEERGLHQQGTRADRRLADR
jgi:formate C-acetyltransferase